MSSSTDALSYAQTNTIADPVADTTPNSSADIQTDTDTVTEPNAIANCMANPVPYALANLCSNPGTNTGTYIPDGISDTETNFGGDALSDLLPYACTVTKSDSGSDS